MKHLGDITKLNGAEVPIVDVICGGSPCQDLSVAGKRAGLAGERSGLFMEQIRIIKEMRNESIKRLQGAGSDVDFRLVRPRYMVWENVPGAFSSNGGEDFRAVLEETARVADESAVIPRPAEKWGGAGCIMGDGWSIAWRVHDAQFWGVPQRRKRIALVADFGGQTAPEILFERESLPGNLAESEEQGQRIAGTAIDSACESSGVGKCLNPWEVQSKRIQPENGIADALYSGERTWGGGQSYVYCLQGNGIDRADTAGCNGKGWREDQSYTLNTIDRPAVAYSFDSLSSNSMKSSNPHSGCRETEVAKTLDCTDPNPVKNQGGICIVSQNAYDKYTETEQGASLKASGGNYGGVQRIW